MLQKTIVLPFRSLPFMRAWANAIDIGSGTPEFWMDIIEVLALDFLSLYAPNDSLTINLMNRAKYCQSILHAGIFVPEIFRYGC